MIHGRKGETGADSIVQGPQGLTGGKGDKEDTGDAGQGALGRLETEIAVLRRIAVRLLLERTDRKIG